ncbi:MAG: phosphoglucosamine mutase [Actinobacteria bacterium]|jgi:phosphoglucosamine mutase|nr:phosphoglucosamine mutase [Actinomycetota bacterium]
MLHFGTDGVRGVAIDELTPELARDLARATSRVLQPVAVVIGRDTRESGPALEKAIIDGCAAEGVPVYLLGVAPTPAVAFASERNGWVGIAITASHNPWADNGIKVFASGGVKLDDAEQIEIERVWHALTAEPAPVALGTVHDASHIVAEYATHRFNIIGGSLAGLSVVLDCAHGAMSSVAAEVFHVAGANVEVINASPNGRNINEQCGATSPQALAQHVIATRADLGIAFDGDGDRLMAVTATGRVIDGDYLMAIAALDLSSRGLLRNKGVAVTVMSNLGFHHAMRNHDVDVVVTPVGDRNVLVALDEYDFVLGGEQSGHIVHRAHATTGDGLLAALVLCEYLVRSKESLDEAVTIMETYPQVLINVRTENRVHDPVADIASQIAAAEKELGDEGRILVRASGTEPLVRVMVEAANESLAHSTAEALALALIAVHGGSIEGKH